MTRTKERLSTKDAVTCVHLDRFYAVKQLMTRKKSRQNNYPALFRSYENGTVALVIISTANDLLYGRPDKDSL